MSTKSQVVSKIIDYIDKNLEEDLNLDLIANEVGYSKYHLSRLFSKEIGCTMHQYIKNKRLENAANQLMNTKLPIAEIAFISGYESQQAFTYAFKQLYLESPQVYRRKTVYVEARMHGLRRGTIYRKNACQTYLFHTFLVSEVKVA